MRVHSSEVKLPPAVDVMGLPIRSLLVEELVSLVAARARERMRTRIAYCNAHTTNLSCDDESLRSDLRDMEILYADGAAVVWASQFTDHPLPERMTAAGFFDAFIDRAADEGLSLYLLGGERGIAESAAMGMRIVRHDLKVVGAHHGFFSDADSLQVIKDINAAKPDILLVGLSTPRQEHWVNQYANVLTPSICWCVGALLDYYAGKENRGPAWLCDHGGEWLFRLMEDPAGKWRRYLIGNPQFVGRASKWAWEQYQAKKRAGTRAFDGNIQSLDGKAESAEDGAGAKLSSGTLEIRSCKKVEKNGGGA